MAPRLVFAVLALATWFLASVLHLPLLWYLPLEHRFAFGATVRGLGMDFYGRLLLAAAVGGVGALAASRMARAERWVRPLTVWVLVVFAFTVALNITQLSRRVPVPVEAPPALRGGAP